MHENPHGVGRGSHGDEDTMGYLLPEGNPVSGRTRHHPGEGEAATGGRLQQAQGRGRHTGGQRARHGGGDHLPVQYRDKTSRTKEVESHSGDQLHSNKAARKCVEKCTDCANGSVAVAAINAANQSISKILIK